MNIILIYMCCMHVIIHAGGTSDYERYLQAHNTYAQKEYNETISILTQLPHNNFPVLYNLGWSYVRNNQLYEALKTFKKALLYSSGKQYLKTVALCEQIKHDLCISIKNTYYIQLYTIFNAYCPTILLQNIFLLMLLICSIYFLKIHKKMWIIALLLCITLIFGIIVYDRFHVESRTNALIKYDNIRMFAGPADWYTILCTVKQGSDAYITSHEGNWYCISCNGCSGWVKATDLDVIS